MYDVIIIGAGVIGCSIAAELSRYSSNILVIEKKDDVAEGASKANSGIVHAGYDAIPNSNKAKFNTRGAKMYAELCKKLGVPYKKNGALVLGFDEEDEITLNSLKERAQINGVPNCEIIYKEDIQKLEPNVNPSVRCALYVKDSGLVSPYELTYAYADLAAQNGVRFKFNCKAEDIFENDAVWTINKSQDMKAKTIILCAGVGADLLHNMISDKKINIIPRRGEYYLLDHEHEPKFKHTLFQVPSKMGKGVLVAPTTHNNIILGPTAEDIKDSEDTSTSDKSLKSILIKVSKTWPKYELRHVITTFSGVRAHEVSDDFIIGKVDGANNGAFEATGIESPGLSSAPAIAEYLSKEVVEYLRLQKRDDYKEAIPVPKAFSSMSMKEKKEAYLRDNNYGRIVCRCEQVTEAEIRWAINRPVGAKTMDGVKRRTRAGMGRCQAGFCTNRIAEILSEELNIEEEQVTKHGGKSFILTGSLKKQMETNSDE